MEEQIQGSSDPKKNLRVLQQGLFLVSLPIFFINFSIPVQAKQLGASATEIGFLFAVFTLSLLLLRPVVGYFIDRGGRKPFLLMAMFFYAISSFAYSNAVLLEWMYGARFVQGIGAALLLITIDTITSDLTTSADRPSAMGRNIEVQTRASMVGATIGFSLLGAMPSSAWQYSFGLFALGALAALLLLTLRLEESKKKPTANVHLSFNLSPMLKRLVVVTITASFANALIQPIYLIYLQDKFNLPAETLAAAFLPGAFVFAVLPSRLSRLTTRVGTVNILSIGLTLTGLLYLFLPLVDHIVVFVLFYTISAVGWAMSEPARKALTAELSQDGSTGRTFGVTELYAGIGATIGPVLGGIIYDHHGSAVTFIANGSVLVIVAIVAKFLLRAPE